MALYGFEFLLYQKPGTGFTANELQEWIKKASQVTTNHGVFEELREITVTRMDEIMTFWWVGSTQELTYTHPIWKELIDTVVRNFYGPRSHILRKSKNFSPIK